ncbi:hypothetical protein [Chryseobacterium indologenes]|uniref:hypothetical protein n=1 Tax=Chryseobacterium indologenes TaxID=253 RepID=UPI0040587B78
MKKKKIEEKKLSLKKMQIMKVNQMRIIRGAGGEAAQLGFNDGNDDPIPTPLQTASGK